MNAKEIKNWLKLNFRSDNSSDWINAYNFKKNILPRLPKDFELVSKIEKDSDWNPQINCFEYALGKKYNGENVAKFVKNNFKEIQYPLLGHFVFYSKTDHNNYMNHVGIYQENNLIISKWGHGPVFKCRVDLLEDYYGNYKYYMKL